MTEVTQLGLLRRSSAVLFILFGSVCGLSISPAALASSSTIDFPGARDTFAYGVSSNGDIVGAYTDSSSQSHGYLLHAGAFTTIDYPGAAFTVAWGMNSYGDIVGYYLPPGSTCLKDARGFLRHDGAFTSIDVPGAARTQALGINAQGDIVGFYDLPGDVCSLFPPARPFRGFVLHQGVFTDINVPGAFLTAPQAINAQGAIVGAYFTYADNQYHGFVFNQGAFSTIDHPGSVYTGAVSIDPQGDVLGSYGFPNVSFLLRRGTFSPIDLSSYLYAAPSAISSRGEVVGSFMDVNYFFHGFVMDVR
jgi:uncharacterized membrane protein